MILRLIVILGVMLCSGVGLAQQNDFVQPYDGLAASRDAYRYHEFDRQDAIRRQVALNDAMKWYSGIGPYFGGAVYYRSRPSLDYLYANPLGWSSQYSTGVWGGPSVFEPWPVVPGDIWGFPYVRTVPQPIGQRQVQTGPNTWESHPIYVEEHLASDAAPVGPPERLPVPQLPTPSTARDF